MMRMLFLALSVLAAPAAAQLRPQPGTGDPRLQTVDYDAGQIVQLHGASGYQITVQLSSEEQVESVAVGDAAGWQISSNRAGDHLFIKPLQAQAPTNMTVITSVRVYNFELIPLPSPASDMAWNVRFRYPAAAATATGTSEIEFLDPSPRRGPASRYQISGDRRLRPSSVSDDGRQTYVRWPADSAIPAVFGIVDGGEEMLLNGTMHGDDYVIDGVPKMLTFRMDGRTARASWVPPKRNR